MEKCGKIVPKKEGKMDWGLILGSGGLAGLAFMIYKIGRYAQKFESNFQLIDKRFDEVDKKFEEVKLELKEIKNRIHSVDVRLSVLESENIFYNCIPDPNIRSEAAKEMWRRKKQKKLELQGSNKGH